MLLSICIIFHNQKEYIARCLSSVLSQQMDFEYEILLGDDNSTDGTWEELQKYQKKYNGLISCYRINTNDYNPLSNTCRSGLNRANLFRRIKGKYFTFIDGDDYILTTDRYKKQIDVLEKNDKISIVSGNTAKYLESKPVKFLNYITPIDRYNTGTIFTEKEFMNIFFHNSTCVIRKPTDFDIDKDFKPELFDDFKITLFFLRYGDMYYINEPFLAYMQTPTGIYSSISEYSKHIGGIFDIPDCLYFFSNCKNEYIYRFAKDLFFLVRTKSDKTVSSEDLMRLKYASDKLYNELGINAEKERIFKKTIRFLYLFEKVNNKLRKFHLPAFKFIYKLIFKLSKIKKYY